MDAEEMLDVIHYMMEDDLNLVSAEQAEARTKTRSMLYELLYSKSYKYGKVARQSSRPTTFDFEADDGFVNNPEGGMIPFDPSRGVNDDLELKPVKPKTKGYVPPTDFNPNSGSPFGKILDSPMN